MPIPSQTKDLESARSKLAEKLSDIRGDLELELHRLERTAEADTEMESRLRADPPPHAGALRSAIRALLALVDEATLRSDIATMRPEPSPEGERAEIMDVVRDATTRQENDPNGIQTPLDTDLRNQLAAPDGASLVGYLQPTMTAIPRTVFKRLSDDVSAKDFGAKGDGVTDDTLAIQRAIDHVENHGGGEVVFPTGQYLLGSQSTRTVYISTADNFAPMQQSCCLWLPPNVSLVGRSGSKLRRSGGSINAIIGVVDWRDAAISGLELHGAGAQNNTAHGIGVFMTTAHHTNSNVAFRNLFIHHVGSYGIGFQYGGADNVLYENIRLEDIGADAIDHKIRFSPHDMQYWAGRGAVFHSINVRRFGLRVDGSSALDIRGIATLSDIHVSEFGADGRTHYGITMSAGIAGVTNGDVRQPAARSTLTNFFIEAASPSIGSTIGIHLFSCGPVAISNGYVHWCKEGVWCRPATASPSVWLHGPSVSNVIVEGARGSTGGFVLQHVRSKLTGCTSISDIQYFDAKRNNLSAGQTRFVIQGGIDAGVLGVRVLRNGVTLSRPGDYSVQGAEIVLTAPAVASDQIVVVTPMLRAVRVEASDCTVIGHDFDDYCLNGVSITAAALDGGMFFANRSKFAYLSQAYPTGLTQLVAVSEDADADIMLSPKGAGLIRLGTALVATTDAAISGYIQVKDRSGNVRKLAVIP